MACENVDTFKAQNMMLRQEEQHRFLMVNQKDPNKEKEIAQNC